LNPIAQYGKARKSPGENDPQETLVAIMKRARGKVAIVIGGARGIGYAVASILVQEGARVVIADIDEAQGRAAARRLGPAVCFERHDVLSELDWLKLAKSVMRRNRRIDVLVNNAGIYLIKPIAETTLQEL
jgi:NAD(P)-dependent dehydrogenase (short-subunit alcohol dehydrogenase family)